MSLPIDRYRPLNMSPQKQKQRTIEVLVEGLAALAISKPLLIVFEDVHWIDPTTLEAHNPEALRPRFKTWIEGLRKAGLDVPDETDAAD
jgi:predicted protein tyrosine phosphatase